MNEETKSLIWLIALTVFFSTMVGVLIQRHMSEHSKFDFDKLLLDRNGNPDIGVIMLLALFFVDVFVIVYVLLKNITSNPLLEALFGIFNLAFAAPLITKVIFKGKTPPAANEILKGAHVENVEVKP